LKFKKEKLIDRLVKKDYNNELEEVLSKKTIDEEVKSLLLDILYKIENAYNDYSKVKNNTLTKEEYIQNIINIVRNNCDIIRFITPEESKARGNRTFIVNKERKEILCYPIARKLLYSLAKIKKSDDIIKSPYSILNRTLTNTINTGNNINTVEPFRDFNGFSWNISTSEIENFYYNLIYQDLIILVGNKFLEEWTNQNDCMIDYIELFKSGIENKYGKKISKSVVESIKVLAILLELSIDKDFNIEMQSRKDKLKQKLDKMNNKEIYLEEICQRKKELAKKIKNIDIIINDKELLESEYRKINEKLPLEEKIFSTRVLAKRMEKEREDILNEIEEYNKLMDPRNYRKERDELQTEYKYVSLVETENLDKQIFKEIISLQKEVLRCIRIKAINSKDKDELIKVIYEMRYFNLIPINENQNISNVSGLSRISSITQKEILKKAQELKLVNGAFQDESKDIEFFKYIFSLQIISLEDVYFRIYKEKEDYYVQFFDEDIIDEKFKINLKVQKDDFKIKINKKNKLFV
jgi:hypothetical protein